MLNNKLINNKNWKYLLSEMSKLRELKKKGKGKEAQVKVTEMNAWLKEFNLMIVPHTKFIYTLSNIGI